MGFSVGDWARIIITDSQRGGLKIGPILTTTFYINQPSFTTSLLESRPPLFRFVNALLHMVYAFNWINSSLTLFLLKSIWLKPSRLAIWNSIYIPISIQKSSSLTSNQAKQTSPRSPMEQINESALTQMRKSVQKLGSSTEVNFLFAVLFFLVLLCLNVRPRRNGSSLFHLFLFAEVRRPNTHEVLNCEVNGLRKSSQDVCTVAEMESCIGPRWVRSRIWNTGRVGNAENLFAGSIQEWLPSYDRESMQAFSL